jgi:hypothetical protein
MMTQLVAGFNGLTMPVFTAFGWAGEEAALSFALAELDLFVAELHGSLRRTVQEQLPVYGLSQENKSVYLAALADVEEGVNISFIARPLSFEVQLSLSGQELLNKGLSLLEKDLSHTHKLLSALGSEWSLRVQQMEVDEESGEAAHYQDLFKDSADELSEELAVAVFSRAAYLNREAQWKTPITVSRRISSEAASAMGAQLVDVTAELVDGLMPLIQYFTGQTVKRSTKAKPKPRPKPKAAPVAVEEEASAEPGDGFTYLAELMPLHLRRGFVNLTSEHWPYFAVNSRTTTREVTVRFDDMSDEESAVWRLLPDDQARLVLGPTVHRWLEEYFDPYDYVEIVARKVGEQEIQLTLGPVE